MLAWLRRSAREAHSPESHRDPGEAATSRGVADLVGVDVEDRTCIHPHCEVTQSELMTVPLCDRHAVDIYRKVKAAIETKARIRGPQPLRSETVRGVVYFVELGDRIKIGFTTNLTSRLKTVPAERVLATMPGTMRDEQAMHARFESARVYREWFTKSPELLDFIETIAA